MTRTYSDMHDGDQKQVIFKAHNESHYSMEITPYNNSQTWVVNTFVSIHTNNATVDFRVDGKPSPPPCALTATVWSTTKPCADGKPTWITAGAIEFSDPTGKIATTDASLNAWIATDTAATAARALRAVQSTKPVDGPPPATVYQDMHDGDKKSVATGPQLGQVTIKPYDNNQTWQVVARWQPPGYCTATVDFRVPNKPSPPPVSLLAHMEVWGYADKMRPLKSVLTFTDPSGTLAAPTAPLNAWLSHTSAE